MSKELYLAAFNIENLTGIEYEGKVDAESDVTVKFLFTPDAVGATDVTDLVKKLQTGLNQYQDVKTLKVDGVYGPLTDAALKAAGYASPLNKSDFEEIVAPNTDSSGSGDSGTPSGNTQSKSQPQSDPKASPKMTWNPFGVSFKQNTKTQKALVWGIWLIVAGLALWGMIELFSSKKK